jgi:hypothetical protein
MESICVVLLDASRNLWANGKKQQSVARGSSAMYQTVKVVRNFLIKTMWLVLCLELSACVSYAEHEQLVDKLRQLENLIELRLTQRHEEEKRLWRELRCSDPRVADFMAEAEQCQSGQCPQRNLEAVLSFMVNQKHVLIRLYPNQEVNKLVPVRVSQLRDMLDQSQLTGLSRIVMLTMAVNIINREESVQLPEKQADAIFFHIRKTLQLALSTPRIGPFPVNCVNKTQLLDGYSRHVNSDKPVTGEPKSKDPQVAVWIFRVDC